MAKKTLLLLVLAALGIFGGKVSAQEQLIAPLETEFDDPSPKFGLPEMPSGSGTRSPGPAEGLPAPIEDSENSILNPFADPLGSGNLQESKTRFDSGEENFLLREPALLESSGTWLRRGFWYTELDVVVSDLIWRRDSLVILNQVVGSTFDPVGRRVFLSNDLTLNGGQNGAGAAPRLKLGRFLFRDHKNRDHAIEFTIYGGGQWSQNGRLDVNPNFIPIPGITTPFLTVPVEISRGNASFTGAASSQFQYDSRINNFEFNYHVSSRMTRDRMELEPSGTWVRRAQPSASWSMIAGIRYVDLSENFDWDAFGIPDANGDAELEQGTYDIRTNNNLIGTQLGFSWAHERARWSLGAKVKGGVFLNNSEVISAFDVTGSGVSGSNRIEADNLSLLSDAAVQAKWHLRPNVSIRAGVDAVFLTSLTLAPNQINFAPVATSENIVQGNSTYLSGSIGLETYW